MKFDGYPLAAFKFFRAIKTHNNREWFLKNRPTLETNFVAPSVQLIEALLRSKEFRGAGLKGDPKKALFRMNRDIRFSSDKSLYKTYNGFSLSRSGLKNENGVFYFHFEPGHAFMAAGFWQPDKALVNRFRSWMIEKPAEYRKLVTKLKKQKLELSSEDQLKRSPRGLEHITDPLLLAGLKRKSYICVRALSDKELQLPSLESQCRKFLADALPLLRVGWPLVDEWRLGGGDPEFHEALAKMEMKRARSNRL